MRRPTSWFLAPTRAPTRPPAACRRRSLLGRRRRAFRSPWREAAGTRWWSARACALLAPVLPSRRVAVVSDAAVAASHGPALRAGMEEAGFAVAAEVEVRPGEASKDFATLHRVLEELLAAGIVGRTAVVALGGGVVGDLGGFAAAV